MNRTKKPKSLAFNNEKQVVLPRATCYTTLMKTLDLHGYAVDEAIDALDRFLYRSSKEIRVKVMTGKGTGAIYKAVTEYLAQGNFQWQYEMVNKQPNKGVLIVFMN